MRRLLLTVVAALATAACVAPAAAPAAVPRSSPVVTIDTEHAIYAHPGRDARRVGSIAPTRPLTGQQTVLPLLGTQRIGAQTWLRVRLPGRPNGRSGWIGGQGAEVGTTPWSIRVQLDPRRVLVYRGGALVRRFSAIIGKAETPTPHGRFFVEETVRMDPDAPGAPWALATSARSNLLKHFEGGVGQVALHGTGNLTGQMGTPASHGCVRLGDRAIRYLAAHIGPGVPITIASR